MSKVATPPIQTTSNATTPTPSIASSVWSRGPPPAQTSNPSSNLSSEIPTPTRPVDSPLPQVGNGKTLPDGAGANGNGLNGSVANGPVPVAIAGHSRKGSLMVGGGMDIKRGSIAFGTVDSPNPLLSSSPAAPSTTGAHLADTVKAFGSIDADASTDPSAVKAARRTSTLVSPVMTSPPVPGVVPPKQQLDMHALFGAKPQPNGTSSVMSPPSAVQSPMSSASVSHDRRQSMNQGPSSFQVPNGNGQPQSTAHPYQISGMPYGQNHFRPLAAGSVIGQPRSPVLGHMGPGQYNGQVLPHLQQGFRPPQQGQAGGMMQPNVPQQGQGRPNGPQPGMMLGQQRPSMLMGQQGMSAYGLHPGPSAPYSVMGYQQQGYYPPYNVYDTHQFGLTPQWAPQQHPQNQPGFNVSVSPRGPQAQLGGLSQSSPSPHAGALPSSGGPSPTPTPPSRPPSLMSGHQPTPSTTSMTSSIPSTPSRPMPQQQAPTFTPQVARNQAPPQTPFGGLSIGASSFTPAPRASKAIKISRPDGTALDFKKEAAALVAPKPTPSSSSSGPATPETPLNEGQLAEPTKKKTPALPIFVRLESEDQKKARIEDEARRERIRKEEEREEIDRKERKERLARDEEERKAKEKLEAEQAEKEKADKAKMEKIEADAAVAAGAKTDEEATIEEKRKSDETFAAEKTAAKKAEEEHEAVANLALPKEAQEEEAQDKAETEKLAVVVQATAQEAREQVDEKSRALLTPPFPSAPASPLGSPALLAAGLPPKPVAIQAVGARRPVPSNLEINVSSPAMSDEAPTASVSALSTARPIDDLKSIVYPGSFKSPSPELNLDAQPGKFRYDRDFLMQFMNVCREKPDSLPPLEEIGLGAEASSGFGTTRGPRGSRSSMGPPPARGAAPTGLGIGGLGNRSAFPGQGMGSFGMGNFAGSGSITRGTTSEERYNKSMNQGRLGSMTRTPSQGGPAGLAFMQGLPPMGASTSRGGANRSQRGTKRLPQDSRSSFQVDPSVVPLVISNNAWTRPRNAGDEEGSPAYVERKVKALLNKLTAERFDTISKQILDWANNSEFENDGMTLKLVIKQIFEKATDEAHWSAMYARLCRLLLEQLNPAITELLDGKPVSGGYLFRKYLLGRCQLDFEAGWKAREDAATAAAAKSEEDKERLAANEKNKDSGGGEAEMLSDEYYAAEKAKRRGLGLVQLIGELFKLDMIGKGVIRTCFVKLLQNVDSPDEEDIESTVKLLTTVGEPYEEVSADNTEVVFERLNAVMRGENVASRIKFMIMDLIDLRRAKWQSRGSQASSSMTIAQVHQQAAREQSEKAAAAAQSARESISRGGSRAGHARRDGPQPGEWQSVATGARPLQRPTDFSNIGRNISSSGSANPISFGPSSVFSKNRKPGAPGVVTPPLSRQASTSNMFGVLRDEPAEAAAAKREGAEVGEAAPQRKKLTLQPRTKPLEGEDDEGEAEGGVEGAEEDTASEDEVSTPAETNVGMSANAVKTKIASDMKELWGEKDVGGSRNPDDIVEYFRALPEDHRSSLAEKLVEDVFRIAKPKDVEIVGKGWTAALEQGVATTDTLRQGLEARMPGLDDDSIDFPQAYRAVAILMRSISLPEADIDALLKKVDVYGEPRITPKMKLDKALAVLDEEIGDD